VPLGTHTAAAWHKWYGTINQKVAVGANETATVKFVLKPPKVLIDPELVLHGGRQH
jgi:hypothetical protein